MVLSRASPPNQRAPVGARAATHPPGTASTATADDPVNTQAVARLLHLIKCRISAQNFASVFEREPNWSTRHRTAGLNHWGHHVEFSCFPSPIRQDHRIFSEEAGRYKWLKRFTAFLRGDDLHLRLGRVSVVPLNTKSPKREATLRDEKKEKSKERSNLTYATNFMMTRNDLPRLCLSFLFSLRSTTSLRPTKFGTLLLFVFIFLQSCSAVPVSFISPLGRMGGFCLF